MKNISRCMMLQLILLLNLLLLFGAVCAEEAPLQVKVSRQSSACSNSRVAVSAENNIFIVWDGLLGGRSRIFFREKSAGRWGPEIILDRTDWGDNSEPAIALDEKGNPHVVWTFHDPAVANALAESATELSAVHYAFRLRNNWVMPVIIRQNAEKNCEFADIAVQSGTNRVFVTWQEGRGSIYAIWCATQDKKGRFVAEQVSATERQGYNMYPEIFIAPTTFVTWYGAEGSDFSLHAALFNIQTERWMRYAPDGLENLPANRLPYLMADMQGVLHAVWYDSDGSTDRIYFGRQGDGSSCKGFIVDGNPRRINSLPMGVVSQRGRIYLCWRGESIFGGQVFLTSGVGDYPFRFEEPTLVSDGQKLFYTEPDCAPDAAGGVVAVWVSSALDGGDGAVYMRSIKP